MQEVTSQIILACLAGDREAMGVLVRQYETPLFDVLRRMTPDRVLAEDLAQEAFLRVFHRLPQYRSNRGPFSSWLFAIVRNLLRDHRAREVVRWRGLRLFQLQAPRGAAGPAPDRQLLGREIHAIVEREVRRLPEEQRLALILRAYQHLPYEEIAEVMGVRPGTAKSRVHRARSQLRAALVPLLRSKDPVGLDAAGGRQS